MGCKMRVLVVLLCRQVQVGSPLSVSCGRWRDKMNLCEVGGGNVVSQSSRAFSCYAGGGDKFLEVLSIYSQYPFNVLSLLNGEAIRSRWLLHKS
jgi:hypothetical protein